MGEVGVVLRDRLERVLVTSCPLHVATGDGCSHTPEQLVGDRVRTLPSPQGPSPSRESKRLSWTLATECCCSEMLSGAWSL